MSFLVQPALALTYRACVLGSKHAQSCPSQKVPHSILSSASPSTTPPHLSTSLIPPGPKLLDVCPSSPPCRRGSHLTWALKQLLPWPPPSTPPSSHITCLRGLPGTLPSTPVPSRSSSAPSLLTFTLPVSSVIPPGSHHSNLHFQPHSPQTSGLTSPTILQHLPLLGLIPGSPFSPWPTPITHTLNLTLSGWV